MTSGPASVMVGGPAATIGRAGGSDDEKHQGELTRSGESHLRVTDKQRGQTLHPGRGRGPIAQGVPVSVLDTVGTSVDTGELPPVAGPWRCLGWLARLPGTSTCTHRARSHRE